MIGEQPVDFTEKINTWIKADEINENNSISKFITNANDFCQATKNYFINDNLTEATIIQQLQENVSGVSIENNVMTQYDKKNLLKICCFDIKNKTFSFTIACEKPLPQPFVILNDCVTILKQLNPSNNKFYLLDIVSNQGKTNIFDNLINCFSEEKHQIHLYSS